MRHPKGIPFKYKNLIDYRMEIPGDSYYWYKVYPLYKKAKGITIHHSAGSRRDTPDDIANDHLRRWGDGTPYSAGIGYHFVITSNGKTYYVGDLGTMRAHVRGKNHRWVGICIIGSHHKYAPTKAQYKSAHKLVKELQKKYPNMKKLVRHMDLQATACPGKYTDMDKIINGLPKKPKKEKPMEEPQKTPKDKDGKEIGTDVPTNMLPTNKEILMTKVKLPDPLKGYKTYIGAVLTALGAFGVPEMIGGDEKFYATVNVVLVVVGLLVTAYGRYMANR